MPDKLRLSLRLLGLAVGIAIGWQTGALLNLAADDSDPGGVLLVMALAVGGIGYVLGPHVSRAVFRNLRTSVRTVSTLDLIAAGVGLAFGGLVSALFAVPLANLPHPFGAVLPFVVAVPVCGLAVAIALLRKRDLVAPWLGERGNGPTSEAATPPPVRSGVLLDTSVVIDGRLPDLVRTGFLDARLLVPRFVLDELQHIADAEDPLRRTRGRRGLEALDRLRQDLPDGVEVIAAEADPAAPEAVDARLVRLAQRRGVALLTNDYNLDRVARIQGVRVLNLTELAAALRPQVLPGEELSLKVVQAGREAGQGVGFLDDGTMVVVDGGQPLVGQHASVTVVRLLQTGAGRMVFAVPKHAASRAS